MADGDCRLPPSFDGSAGRLYLTNNKQDSNRDVFNLKSIIRLSRQRGSGYAKAVSMCRLRFGRLACRFLGRNGSAINRRTSHEWSFTSG